MSKLMKKALVLLVALVLSASAVFAAVEFSGELVAGYAFQNNGSEWTNHIMGQDGEDTNTTRLDLSIADENGIWAVTLDGAFVSADDGGMAADVTVDVVKAVMAAMNAGETDWFASIKLDVMDRLVGYRVYSMEKDLDRIRTAETGLWTSLQFGYGDLINVMVAGSPNTKGVTGEPNQILDNEGDFMVSAITNPINGLSVSATYVLKGDANDSGNDHGTDEFANGIIGGTANIDIGSLVGLDWNIGVAVSDKYDFGVKNNIFAAEFYTVFVILDFMVQYGLKSYDQYDDEHFFYAGIDFNVVEHLVLDIYGGAYDLSHADESWYLGGNVGYEVSGVTFKLGLEYGAGASYAYDDNYWNDEEQSGKGLWIVPSISVKF